MKLTQTDRLIKAARSYRGITRVDFQAPDVIDGGEPILNFPARLLEASEAGYGFECLGKRNRCKIWRLVSEPGVDGGAGVAGLVPSPVAEEGLTSSLSTASTAVSPGTLFEPEHQPTPHWKAA